MDYSLELGPPIVTLKDARKQNSFHSVPPLPGTNTNLPSGEKSAVPYVEKCPMQIRGAKWHMPTQVCLGHPSAKHTDFIKAPGLGHVRQPCLSIHLPSTAASGCLLLKDIMADIS